MADLLVKAFALGYHGCLREPGGDPFYVEDTEENRKSTWFKPHAADEPADTEKSDKAAKPEKKAK